MHFTPIEIYLILLLIAPLGICFWKWQTSYRWLIATAVCAAVSWFYFNLWMWKLDPPDNGFANAIYLVTGWIWLLPFFGIFSALFAILGRFLSEKKKILAGKIGFTSCVAISALVIAWNLWGRMSEQRAITEARNKLEEFGYQPNGREEAVYKDGHWIILYPDTDFGEIRLKRNGGLSWIGGPG